jgi:hypothetical protein
MQGLLRPDVVMPTNVITTSIVPGGYTSFGGTSASAPHTGGALALLLSAAPNAAPSDLSEALQSFVTDLGAPGKDNDFGAGLPDLARAAGFLVPEVTPIAEPYGQAIDAGEAIALRLQWINNTSAAVTVWRRITLHHGGVSETVAGPSDLTVPAGGTVSANWHFAATGTLSGELIEIEVAVDAGRGGPPVASTTVQAFVR